MKSVLGVSGALSSAHNSVNRSSISGIEREIAVSRHVKDPIVNFAQIVRKSIRKSAKSVSILLTTVEIILEKQPLIKMASNAFHGQTTGLGINTATRMIIIAEISI